MAAETDLPTCALCARIDALPAGALRLRVTAAPATSLTLSAGGVTLSHMAPSPLRARWDVVVLPAP
jgi:hypothetical protein